MTASAMPSSSTPSINLDLCQAAGNTIGTLKDIGVNACFIGGYAYTILGVPRAVDMSPPSHNCHHTACKVHYLSLVIED